MYPGVPDFPAHKLPSFEVMLNFPGNPAGFEELKSFLMFKKVKIAKMILSSQNMNNEHVNFCAVNLWVIETVEAMLGSKKLEGNEPFYIVKISDTSRLLNILMPDELTITQLAFLPKKESDDGSLKSIRINLWHLEGVVEIYNMLVGGMLIEKGGNLLHFAEKLHPKCLEGLLTSNKINRTILLLSLDSNGNSLINTVAYNNPTSFKKLFDMVLKLDPLLFMKMLLTKNLSGAIPIHFVVQNNLETLKELLKLNPTLIRDMLLAKTEQGIIPMHIAAQCNADSLKVLLGLSNPDLVRDMLLTKDGKGVLPIHVAARNNSESLKELLKLDPDLVRDILLTKDKAGFILMHIAAQWNLKSLKALLELKNPDLIRDMLLAKTEDGGISMHFAAQHNADSLKALLDLKNPDIVRDMLLAKTKEGAISMHFAAQHNLETLKELLKLNSDLVRDMLLAKTEDGVLPIHVAAGNNSESLKELLKLAPDLVRDMLLAKTEEGTTPILLAAKFNLEVLKELLKLNSDLVRDMLLVKDKGGMIPIFFAAQSNIESLKVFLESRAADDSYEYLREIMNLVPSGKVELQYFNNWSCYYRLLMMLEIIFLVRVIGDSITRYFSRYFSSPKTVNATPVASKEIGLSVVSPTVVTAKGIQRNPKVEPINADMANV